jgi:hypothetical protein
MLPMELSGMPSVPCSSAKAGLPALRATPPAAGGLEGYDLSSMALAAIATGNEECLRRSQLFDRSLALGRKE